MAVVDELIRQETNGSISFGNHKLETKEKVDNFEHDGDLYKVKTFKTMTKLERNGLFVYESVPGTSVLDFSENEKGVSFLVEGDEDAQITVGLTEDTEYVVYVADQNIGKMKTGLGGKLNLSVELAIGDLHVSEIIVFRSSRQQGRYEFFKFVVFLSLFSNVCRVPFPVVWIQQIVSHRTLVDALSLRRRIESIVLYVAVVDIEAQIVCIANLTVGNIYLYNAKSCCHHGIFAIHIYIIDSLVFCH